MKLRQWMVIAAVSTEEDRGDHLDEVISAVEAVMGLHYCATLTWYCDSRTGYLIHATREAVGAVLKPSSGLELVPDEMSLVDDQLVHPDRAFTVELHQQLQHRRFPNRETWQRALDTYVPICTGDRIRYLAYRRLYVDDAICGTRTHAAVRHALTPAAAR